MELILVKNLLRESWLGNSKNKSCLRSGKAGQVDMFACFQNSQTFVKQLHLEIEAHVVQKQKET